MGGICSVDVYKPVRQCRHAPWKVVDVSNEAVPEPWASRLIEKGYTDGRYAHDVPSLSKLAGDIGVHTSTVSNAINGKRRAAADTVRRLAEALGDDVAVWLGTEHAGPWHPPAAASLLTGRQRKAIEELIYSMTERQENDRGNTTPIGAPEKPGPDDFGLSVAASRDDE